MIGIVDQLREDHEYFLFGVHDSGYELREVYGPTMIHADSQVDDEDVRVLSVIIALTDDYDGGIFNFPKQSYQVKLKKGELLLSHLLTFILMKYQVLKMEDVIPYAHGCYMTDPTR